jgi:hypothetical protein
MTMQESIPTRSLSELMWVSHHRGGSELQAGGRALLNPTPMNKALSSVRGRMASKSASVLGFPKHAEHFIGGRVAVMVHLMTSAVNGLDAPLTADAFAAYSPIGFEIAERLPHGQHLDFADIKTIHDIQRRLGRDKTLHIPTNHRFQAVDYREETIGDHLPRPLDAIIGNSTSYSYDENIVVLGHLRELLRPGGTLVSGVLWREGIETVAKSMRFAASQAGMLNYPLLVDDDMTVVTMFRAAGFTEVDVVHMPSLAAMLGLPTPIIELEVFAVARR